MFAKLLKHEMKNSGRVLLPLSLGALVAGVIGGLVMRMDMSSAALTQNDTALTIAIATALPFAFLALLAYGIGGEIYLAVQFYKRKFTDQGYLTFTLPARGWKIYLSSLLNMMIWSFVILLVTILGFVGMYLIGMYGTEVWNRIVEQGASYYQEMEMYIQGPQLLDFVSSAVNFLSSHVLLITCITLGSVLAKKHKILAAGGVYYLVSFLIDLAESFATFLVEESPALSTDSVYAVTIGVGLAVSLLGSVFSIWLMDRKLNLP